MTKIRLVVSILFALSLVPASSQTIDVDALSKFSPAVMRQAFDVCRYVKLTPEQQVKLAGEIEKADDFFVQAAKKNDGVLPMAAQSRLVKMKEKMISSILDEEQQEQYWRGVYGAEAQAEGAAIANTLQKKYDLTDQNWKFINVSFYKIALEERVIKKMMADQPKKAAKKIEELRDYYIKSIEEKGGIRVDPKKMKVTVVREFDPNGLIKE